MQLNQRIANISGQFLKFQSWEDRYRHMIHLGRELEPLEEEFKTDQFRIKGCQSQVWLYPSFEGGKVFFKADSDSALVKGISAMVVQVYSGSTPGEILEERSDFLKEIGITQHLSMNRSNGLASMLKQVKLYALAYLSIEQGSKE